jgi:hypothetical protein
MLDTLNAGWKKLVPRPNLKQTGFGSRMIRLARAPVDIHIAKIEGPMTRRAALTIPQS